MRPIRSGVAIVFGYVLAAVSDLVFVYLAWVHSRGGSGFLLMLAAVAWLGLAGAGIGMLVGFIAGRGAVLHAALVAAITAIIAAVGLVVGDGAEPLWYRFVEIFILAPSIVGGASAYLNRLRRRVPQAT